MPKCLPRTQWFFVVNEIFIKDKRKPWTCVMVKQGVDHLKVVPEIRCNNNASQYPRFQLTKFYNSSQYPKTALLFIGHYWMPARHYRNQFQLWLHFINYNSSQFIWIRDFPPVTKGKYSREDKRKGALRDRLINVDVQWAIFSENPSAADFVFFEIDTVMGIISRPWLRSLLSKRIVVSSKVA